MTDSTRAAQLELLMKQLKAAHALAQQLHECEASADAIAAWAKVKRSLDRLKERTDG